jgi:TatD DNase family protein
MDMTPLFDAHLHLFDARFQTVRAEVERCAQEAHVTACIGCAAFPEEWEAPLESAMHVTRAYGVHPWAAGEVTAEHLTHLREVLARDTSAMIGEIGVDGLRPVTDGGAQQVRVLEAQLTLAADLGRPVVLHGARAWNLLFERLQPWVKRLPAVMIHGASFSVEQLRHPVFQSRNVWVSIGGAVVNPKAKRIHALAAAIPQERLLVETDAPDLLPVGGTSLTGAASAQSLNHPGNLPLVVQAVAQLRGCTFDEIATQTYENACNFVH